MAPPPCVGVQRERSGSANTVVLVPGEPGNPLAGGSPGSGVQDDSPLEGGGHGLGRVGQWPLSTPVSTRPSPSWTRTGTASSTRRT